MKLDLIHISDVLGLAMDTPSIRGSLSPEAVSSVAAFQDIVHQVFLTGINAAQTSDLYRK